MSLQSMISGLSHAEKLEAMDLLWRELSRVPSDYVSPEWHERILANRGAWATLVKTLKPIMKQS